MKPPIKYILQGMAIPFLVVSVFGFGGIVVAIMDGTDSVMATAKFGMGVGLFLSLFGGLEIMLGLLFEGGTIYNRFLRAGGFFLVWLIAVFCVLNFF